MAYKTYTVPGEAVTRTYRTYTLTGEAVLKGTVLLAAVSAGSSSDTAELTVVAAPITPIVRIRSSTGWLPLSFGYYTTNTHPAGTTISIPQTVHRLKATRGLSVTIHNETTGAQEVADVTVSTGGNITVTFVSPAAANSKRLTVIGPVPDA